MRKFQFSATTAGYWMGVRDWSECNIFLNTVYVLDFEHNLMWLSEHKKKRILHNPVHNIRN